MGNVLWFAPSEHVESVLLKGSTEEDWIACRPFSKEGIGGRSHGLHYENQ